MALAVPFSGVLAKAAVDEQEVARGRVLGECLAGLAVDLAIHEQRLVAALAVEGQRDWRLACWRWPG